MENQTKKLCLDELKIESFVTSPNANATKGGTWTTITTALIFLPGCLGNGMPITYDQVGPGSTIASCTANAGCDTQLEEVVVGG